MNEKPYAKSVIAFLMAVLIGVAFTGTEPSALTYVHESCYDGQDNDLDGVYGGSMPLILSDWTDGECQWMPGQWGQGEHDNRGLNDPTSGSADVNAYVQTWLNTHSSETPSHFEMLKAWYESDSRDPCAESQVQASLTAYRDDYGLSNEMTGVSLHQSECGVSY